MPAFFQDEAHQHHNPRMWLNRGVVQQSRETPERAEALRAALMGAGYEARASKDLGLPPLEQVHSRRYLDFLQTAFAKWTVTDGAGPEVVANAFPLGKDPGYPRAIAGRAGYHMGDLACPIGSGTWRAAYGSAQTALTCAGAILEEGGDAHAYGLCRPPGHHAFADRAQGYCYLNNAAIAAQYLRDKGADRVTILDVDVHHGNGTQDIFYDRADVQVVSIHGDPAEFFPFFWGYTDQIGRGEGAGATINLPLPLRSDENTYLEALSVAIGCIEAYGPDAVVVSLGLDIFAGDPYAAFGVTTAGFGRIAARIRTLRKPVVILQEGGYMCPELGANLLAFLEAFEH
jgi:acetoin utilization deacetylase AcuC-like enzyme